ncbi:MAG: hypothetical protein R3D90_13740 [Paracoccaceae bacterium]
MHLRATFAALFLSLPAFAQDLATGDAITAAIADKTVQGSMVDSGAYTEFYAADGTIRGDGYTGTWSVEGDQMCFNYGEGASCWSVRLNGDSVTWMKDGKEDGTGTLIAGNPNNF